MFDVDDDMIDGINGDTDDVNDVNDESLIFDDEKKQAKATKEAEKNKVDDYTNLWQDEDTKQPANAVNTDNTIDLNKQFDGYVNELNFVDDNIKVKLKEAMDNGNIDDIGLLLNTMTRNSYKKAILDTAKIMDSRIKEVEKRLESRTQTEFNKKDALNKLSSTLPWTNSPDVQPLAQSVYGRFLQKGQSYEQAVESTRKYFAQLSDKAKGQSNKTAQKRIKGNESIQSDKGNVPDWSDIFGS